MGRGIDWYRRPELIFADVIERAARGDDQFQRNYHRATVLAVDLEGAQLQNPTGNGSFISRARDGGTTSYAALIGPANPRGSIKARILTDGLDRLLDDSDVRVFWPALPTDQLGIPVSPGEHVYVFFEGPGMDHGLWLSRVSGQDSANSFRGADSYVAPSAPQSAMDSFEPNVPQYDQTDSHAGLAPPLNPNKFFGDD